MKTLKKLNFGFALIVVFSTVLGCGGSDDDNNSNNNNNNVPVAVNTVGIVSGIVTSGTWRISYFFDSNQDETSNFSGFNFSFGTGNALNATNGTDTYTGTWSVTDSDSYYDYLSDLDFNIAFTGPPNFQELSEDWEILSKSSTSIQLRHVSGGGGGTDFLTFTKN